MTYHLFPIYTDKRTCFFVILLANFGALFDTPKISEQHTEKDDDTMKFTSTTAKAAVHDYIQQAVDKGLINESWLEKFDNGTMTSGDFEGLKFIIFTT